MNPLCYLNGDFLPLNEARVSVLDRGFLLGDGVYEVIPVYAGKPFYWQKHLQRLQNSLATIRLPFDVSVLDGIANRLIEQCGGGELALYLQITRGVAAKRQQAPPADIVPTVFMMCNARPVLPAHYLADGAACVTMEDFRWRRCDIKSISLLASVLIADHAAQTGVDEVVLLRDGLLTEGSSCNYVVVQGQTLFTPVADSRILRGISYQVVLEVAQTLGYQVMARDITQAELFAADELWLTSSLREMLPVTRLDDAPIGSGKPGAVFQAVHSAWQAHIATGSDLDFR